MAARDPRQRGLPSLNEAREVRKRALVTGKARIYGGSPRFWLWTFMGLATFAVIYWKFAQGELESQKSAVMAKQRAIAETLGPKILPFRDKVERWVIELATAPQPQPDMVAGEVSLERLEKGPGVYLRLRQARATSVESIREAASHSLRDGFTSCLFVRREAPTGERCARPSDCPSGKLCDEWGVCGFPSQPYNLRLAYRALRVLSPEWTDELHEATSDLAVRAFEIDLDAVTRNDVPIAAEVLTRARYFTVVLDEEPQGGLPAPIEEKGPEGQRRETDEERIQRVPHRARVGIWDLKTERPLLRLRTDAAGQFVPVGDRAVARPETQAAQQRQVNSCAIALAVREAIEGANQ